jgi:predicted transcriptional regulator
MERPVPPGDLEPGDRPHAGAERLLGELEADIMRVVWPREHATVREVLEALNGERPRQIAYTTVMTVMSRLAEKGLLRRRLVGKTHHYEAAQTEQEFLHVASRRLIRSLIADFGEVAIAEFLAELEQVQPERRRALRRLASRVRQPDH